jgi:hypothetical protein
MIALKEAPGGPEFIERVDAAAANLARFYIDTDEATIRADLVQSSVNLEASLGRFSAELLRCRSRKLSSRR